MDFASAEELLSFPKQVGVDASEDYIDSIKAKNTASKSKLKAMKPPSQASSVLEMRKKSSSKDIRTSAPMLNVRSKSSLKSSKPQTPDRSVNRQL